jgi:hypothetical protein
MLSFGPGFLAQRVLLAVLINNNISQQIFRFFMLKKALTYDYEEIISSNLPQAVPIC